MAVGLLADVLKSLAIQNLTAVSPDAIFSTVLLYMAGFQLVDLAYLFEVEKYNCTFLLNQFYNNSN